MNGHGGQVWGKDGNRRLRLDFSANLWPERGIALPRHLRQQLEPYPDPECRALTAATARYFQVPEDQLLAVNGSTEGLYLAMRMLAPRRLALFEPTFSEYEAAARWGGGAPLDVVRFQSRSEDGFMPHLRPVACDVAALGNPNNPTGALVPRERLIPWIEANQRAGIWTIVDEAFLEFVPDAGRQTLLRDLRRWPRLLVLRSMTKRFGLAGVRLGFVFGASGVIARLRGERIPWSVNTLAQQMGTALARRRPDASLAARVAALRRYLAREFEQLGFEVFPSAANFLLFRMPRGASNRRLLAALRRQGIGLRDASNFHGLDHSYLRCAVRPRAELCQLIPALEEALS